jgi:hypothetical protein
MDHIAVAASTLTAVVIARLIEFAISRAVVVNQHALLLWVIHVVASWMHVLMLIQVIMVGNIIMMTVRSIRRSVRS